MTEQQQCVVCQQAIEKPAGEHDGQPLCAGCLERADTYEARVRGP